MSYTECLNCIWWEPDGDTDPDASTLKTGRCHGALPENIGGNKVYKWPRTNEVGWCPTFTDFTDVEEPTDED